MPMNQPTVISINPAAKPRGILLQDAKRYAAVATRIKNSISITPQLKESLNFFTGINSRTMSGASGRILFLRLLTGIIMLGYSSIIFYTVGLSDAAVGLSVFGASLLFGFMTRIMGIAAIGVFGWMAYTGSCSMELAAAIGFVALVFAVLGPGIFSTDQCLRKAVFRAAKRKARNAYMKLDFNYRSYVQ